MQLELRHGCPRSVAHAMPTRAEKATPSTGWCIYFTSECTESTKRSRGLLLNRIASKGCSVKIVATGRGFVELEWGHAVKYDWARAWIWKTISLDNEFWTFHLAGATEDKVEHPSTTSPARASASRGHATLPATDAIIRATTPPSVLVLKASALLERSGSQGIRSFNDAYDVWTGDVIGEGTYGKVFAGRAKDNSLGELSFNRLPTQCSRDSQAALQEVAAFAAVLPHPHILSLYDVGVDGQSLF